jgi:hypothetical protein
MAEVIDFAKAKADADKSRSAHFISLDVYLNSDNSEVWASVTNAGENDIDASWHNFVADLLRRLAWISDSMAAEIGSEDGKPIASITAFERSRISTRWADDLVVTPEQVDWVRGQMQSGVDEIKVELKGEK